MIVVKRTQADIDALASINIDPKEMEDDGQDYLEKEIKKPWGHEVEKYRDENCSIWWLYIHSGKETSLHCHPHKTTMLTLIGGRATLSSLEKDYELSMGDVVVIEKGAFHQTRAKEGPVVLYELETPPNKRDLVRLQDTYGRGQGYERIGD